MKRAVIVLALLSACGGEGGDPPPGTGGSGGMVGPAGTGGATMPPSTVLVGNWLAMANDSCAYIADFPSASEYVLGTICITSSNAVELQAEAGIYSISGSTLTMAARKATCADTTAIPSSLDFHVTATALSLSSSSALVVYARNTSTDPGNGLAATYGCFRNGVFTPMPYLDL